MPRQKIKIITDACCKTPNAHLPTPFLRKGHSACGVLITDEENHPLMEHGKYLGEMTISQAEYEGLILGLDKGAEICRGEVEVWMDSEFIVRQMNGDYGVKSENMKPLYDKVKILERRYLKGVKYYHHSRNASLAQLADKLADAELRKHRP